MSAFEGQAAVVTGAGSGIGRALAVAIAGEGGRVGLVDIDAQRIAESARAVAAAGGRAEPLPADLASDADVAGLPARIAAALGRLDLLVHCAGFFRAGRFEAVSAADLDMLHRVNVRAPYALTQACLPLLRTARGQVVFVNSSAAVNPGAQNGAYAASKGALRCLADSLRAEVNAEGIRVLSLYPGRTATPMQESIFRAEGRAYDPARLLQPEDVAAMAVAALRLPRTAEVTDIHIRPMLKS